MRHGLRILSASLPVFVAILGATAPAAAQGMPSNQIVVGPRLSLDLNDGTHVAIGGEARFSVLMIAPTVRLDIRPELNFYFFDGGNAFDISGDALFAFGVHSDVVEPYAGAGIGIFHVSADLGGSATRVGLNLLGGAKFLPLQTIQPFVEMRFTVGDFDPILLTGGVLFLIR